MQAPRGTRDFAPEEMERRRHVESRLRAALRTYNYREVQTPTFEDLELFLARSGPGIREELYDFKDKGGRDLALRPELTAPVMRFYFSDLKMRPKPLRLFYFGPCYRYDRPQAGRYREFWQLGAELLGDDTPQAHAELIRLALDLVESTGLQRYELRIGHLELLRALLARHGVPRADQAPLMRLIDKKDLDGLRQQLASRVPPQGVKEILGFFEVRTLDGLRPHVAPEARDAFSHLERVWGRLGDFGTDVSRVRIDPTIARGLEYYTGLVFELDAPDLGAEKQLLGGGAYDLAAVFQQPSVPAVGFALGFDRTLVALDQAGASPGPADALDVHIGSLQDASSRACAAMAVLLRRQGWRVELESAPSPPKKLLARASQLGARVAVFQGAQEAATESFAVKVLGTGQQEMVASHQVASRLRELLRG